MSDSNIASTDNVMKIYWRYVLPPYLPVMERVGQACKPTKTLVSTSRALMSLKEGICRQDDVLLLSQNLGFMERSHRKSHLHFIGGHN